MIEYKIVILEDDRLVPAAFIEMVAESIKDGWILAGGLYVVPMHYGQSRFHQPMTKAPEDHSTEEPA